MNCKPGDLAVIVRSYCGNEGKIVTTIRLSGLIGTQNLSGRIVEEPVWEIDRQICDVFGKMHNFIADSQLRPIRDQPGADETLDWKEVPKPSVMTPKPQKEHT